jgi:transposase InsO family protein
MWRARVGTSGFPESRPTSGNADTTNTAKPVCPIGPEPRIGRRDPRHARWSARSSIYGKPIRRLPFRVHVIQTDNGAEFQSQFHWHVEGLDIRHAYIRPRTPHLNGKVERSHRVDDEGFYQLLDKDGITDDIHLFNEKLREWEDYYNYHRPHGALDGQTPYERMMAKTRAGVLPTS